MLVIPVDVAIADSQRVSAYSAVSIPAIRSSAASVARSSSIASATLSSVEKLSNDGSNRSNSTGSTPSGSATPLNSSASAKAALSRAWSRVSDNAEGSRVPA